MKVSPILSVLFLFVVHTTIRAQDVPCRNWYFVTDAKGNKVKDKCKNGWQENVSGQKHGQYFENFEDGTPSIRANYKNDQLNGKYVEYSKALASNSSILSDSGQFLNGKRSGKWFFQPDYYVSYQNDKPIGKSKHKHESITVEGMIDSQGLYNGTVVFHFNGYFGKDVVFGLPSQDCKNALKLSNTSKSFIDGIFSKYGKETSIASEAQTIDIVCPIIFGNIFALEKCSILIDYVAKPGLINDAVTAALIQNHEHPETNFYTKASEQAKLNSDSSFLYQYLKKYPNGMYVKDVKIQLKGMRASLLDKNSTTINNAFSPTFKNDSYELDENGKSAIKSLRSYLEKIDPQGIKYLIFIGHSSADLELGKYSFDPKEYAHLKNSKGVETTMSEKNLAQLRLILSLGRLKSTIKELEPLPLLSKLIEAKSIWYLPAGDEFGKEFVSKKRNQNVVQVVLITNDNREINTEFETLPYGTEFKSGVLDRINQRIGACDFNFSCFIPKYLRPDSFGLFPPDYTKLSLDSNELANFMNTVNSNCRN